MSAPGPNPSGRSSLRTAGVVLVGVSLVLAVIGVIAGGAHDTAIATAAAVPVVGSAPMTASPAPTTAAAAPTSAAPTSTAAPTASPAPASTAATTVAADPRASVNVVVLNNSTVGGLASRAATQVRGRGWTVVGVGNFTGTIPTTTVYYRPGTAEEGAARALGIDMRARIEPRFDGLPNSAEGLVLVVTSDYAG